jgi:hypothetical protein
MNYAKKLALVVTVTVAGLSACGGGNDGPPPVFTTQILSDPAYDGDIRFTQPATFTVTQGMSPDVQSIFSGVDPVLLDEYRSFLVFHLTGGNGVPGNAIIESAFLDIYVNSLQPSTASLPIVVELVSFQPPTLLATDYDETIQPALASVKAGPNFTQADVGSNASIDVTPLMREAQNRGLVDFQIRIVEDLGSNTTALLEINDSTGTDRAQHAPQLTVTYD